MTHAKDLFTKRPDGGGGGNTIGHCVEASDEVFPKIWTQTVFDAQFLLKHNVFLGTRVARKDRRRLLRVFDTAGRISNYVSDGGGRKRERK